MAKVTNLTDRVQSFLRWKVMPNSSKLIDPRGAIVDVMPDHLAYSPEGKGLADQGFLELEGYTPPKPEAPKAPPPPPVVEEKFSRSFGKKKRDED